jgi:putative spermidine/putrescine transport system permease protein
VTSSPTTVSSGAAEPGAARRPRRRTAGLPQWARVLLLLSPALAVVLGLFAGGLAFGIAQSVGYLPFIDQRDVSLDAYRRISESVAFRASVGLTLRLALTSTVVSAVLAVAGALLVRGTGRGRRLTTFLFQFNLPIPHIVGGVAMLLLLSQSGLVSRMAFALGLAQSPGDFPALVADRFGWAIIAEYVWKEVPFIGVVVLAALAGPIAELEDVARTLGADGWQRFRHVVLPLITPAVASASIIVFAFTFGSYEIPFLLGQPFPAALPVLAFRAYSDADLASRADAMAMSVIIAVFVGTLVLAYMRLSERLLRGSS